MGMGSPDVRSTIMVGTVVLAPVGKCHSCSELSSLRTEGASWTPFLITGGFSKHSLTCILAPVMGQVM